MSLPPDLTYSSLLIGIALQSIHKTFIVNFYIIPPNHLKIVLIPAARKWASIALAHCSFSSNSSAAFAKAWAFKKLTKKLLGHIETKKFFYEPNFYRVDWYVFHCSVLCILPKNFRHIICHFQINLCIFVQHCEYMDVVEGKKKISILPVQRCYDGWQNH